MSEKSKVLVSEMVTDRMETIPEPFKATPGCEDLVTSAILLHKRAEVDPGLHLRLIASGELEHARALAIRALENEPSVKRMQARRDAQRMGGGPSVASDYLTVLLR
uniref:Uncharacterized protein n=1 Tax=viral metagenome TaxID=1070528 RepID=A0A6M3LZM8_9ZZZZ